MDRETSENIRNVLKSHFNNDLTEIDPYLNRLQNAMNEYAEQQVKTNSVLGDVISISCKKCSDRGIIEDYLGNRSTCECHYL